MRGVAATMVVIGHSQTTAGHLALQQQRPFARWEGLPWGASVDMFFVISGFIMVYASRRLFAQPGARADFAARRLTRVVPLYWLYTTLLLAIFTLATLKGGDPYPTAAQIAGSYFFVPVRGFHGGVFPLFDLGWTLNYEMAFYLVFAAFVGAKRRVAVLGVTAVVVGAAVLGSVVDPAAAALTFWTRPIVIDFALGMLVGSLCLDSVVLNRWLRIALVAAGLVFFATDPFHIFAVPLGVTVENGWPRVLLAGIPVALVMAGVVLGPQPRLPAWMRPAVYIGNASYSLYLVHPFVLILVEKLEQKSAFVRMLPLSLVVMLMIAGAIAAAIFSFRVIEGPLTAWADHALGDGRDAWRRRRSQRALRSN